MPIVSFIAGVVTGGAVVAGILFFLFKKYKKKIEKQNQDQPEMIEKAEYDKLQDQLSEQEEASTLTLQGVEEDHKKRREFLTQSIDELNGHIAGIDEGKMTQTVQENMELTRQTIKKMEELLELVSTFERWHDGLNMVKNSLNTINALNDQFQEVGQRAKVLSLNARIEASKSGAAGKGFNIVANEFTGLAQRTSELCHQNREELEKNELLITASFQDTQAGSRMVINTVNYLKTLTDELVGSMTALNDAINDRCDVDVLRSRLEDIQKDL